MLTNGLCGTSEIKVLASGDIELLHNTSGDKFKEVTSPFPALARSGMLTSDIEHPTSNIQARDSKFDN